MYFLGICVSDFWNHCEFWQISAIESEESHIEQVPALSLSQNESQTQDKQKLQKLKSSKRRRVYMEVDGIDFFYLIREILESSAFRWHLLQKARKHNVTLLLLQIKPPEREIIDYKWNGMVSHSLWENIQLDYLISWLSTLGGGFSALGEQFTNCAETAGKISIKQLEIGMRLGNPFMQARCKLYYSLSLIQTKRLRAAKYIVRAQYKFAKKHEEQDTRLIKMCLGIWLRIQHEYRQRMKTHERYLAAGDARNLIN